MGCYCNINIGFSNLFVAVVAGSERCSEVSEVYVFFSKFKITL